MYHPTNRTSHWWTNRCGAAKGVTRFNHTLTLVIHLAIGRGWFVRQLWSAIKSTLTWKLAFMCKVGSLRIWNSSPYYYLIPYIRNNFILCCVRVFYKPGGFRCPVMFCQCPWCIVRSRPCLWRYQWHSSEEYTRWRILESGKKKPTECEQSFTLFNLDIDDNNLTAIHGKVVGFQCETIQRHDAIKTRRSPHCSEGYPNRGMGSSSIYLRSDRGTSWRIDSHEARAL